MTQLAVVAGFEPFGPYPVNPTAELAAKLDGIRVEDVQIKGVVMPASYHCCHHEVLEQVCYLGANRLVTLGLATRIHRIRIETVGRNKMQSKYADVAGFKYDGEPLYTGEREILKVNSDAEALQRQMLTSGVPCEVSEDAEGFVCNALMYHCLYTLDLLRLDIPYVHMHTPWTDRNLKDVIVPPDKAVLKWDVLERAALIALTTLSLPQSGAAP